MIYICCRCNAQFEDKKASLIYVPLCPNCGQSNSPVGVKMFRQEAEKLKCLEDTKKQLRAENTIVVKGAAIDDFGFTKIACVPDDYVTELVYNNFTKIVYMKDTKWNGSNRSLGERYCPFISENGKYYKYNEDSHELEEISDS